MYSELTHRKSSVSAESPLYRSFLRTGFPTDVIRRELHAVTHEAVPDTDAP